MNKKPIKYKKKEYNLDTIEINVMEHTSPHNYGIDPFERTITTIRGNYLFGGKHKKLNDMMVK